jgi:hypothetical protein
MQFTLGAEACFSHQRSMSMLNSQGVTVSVPCPWISHLARMQVKAGEVQWQGQRCAFWSSD